MSADNHKFVSAGNHTHSISQRKQRVCLQCELTRVNGAVQANMRSMSMMQIVVPEIACSIVHDDSNVQCEQN